MKAVEYFNWVRDIPYRIPLNDNEPDYCCEGKHRMLEKLLVSEGLDVRPRIAQAKWSLLSQLDEDVVAFPHVNNYEHLYLEVKLGGRWRAIDASFDSALDDVFPTKRWDGKTSTGISVPTIQIYNPVDSLKLYNIEAGVDTEENEFNNAINTWLDNIRSLKTP